MKKQRITAFLIIMFLLCDIFKLSVFANSAQRFWYGTDAMGMVSKDKDCPIEVEKEQLTFDIAFEAGHQYTLAMYLYSPEERKNYYEGNVGVDVFSMPLALHRDSENIKAYVIGYQET